MAKTAKNETGSEPFSPATKPILKLMLRNHSRVCWLWLLDISFKIGLAHFHFTFALTILGNRTYITLCTYSACNVPTSNQPTKIQLPTSILNVEISLLRGFRAVEHELDISEIMIFNSIVLVYLDFLANFISIYFQINLILTTTLTLNPNRQSG